MLTNTIDVYVLRNLQVQKKHEESALHEHIDSALSYSKLPRDITDRLV